jgi:hypothetical protein
MYVDAGGVYPSRVPNVIPLSPNQSSNDEIPFIPVPNASKIQYIHVIKEN